MKRMKPTNQDKAVYEYIVSYLIEHQYSPTVRNIGDGVGLTSTASVFCHLAALKRMGFIDYVQKQPRTITLKGYRITKID